MNCNVCHTNVGGNDIIRGLVCEFCHAQDICLPCAIQSMTITRGKSPGKPGRFVLEYYRGDGRIYEYIPPGHGKINDNSLKFQTTCRTCLHEWFVSADTIQEIMDKQGYDANVHIPRLGVVRLRRRQQHTREFVTSIGIVIIYFVFIIFMSKA